MNKISVITINYNDKNGLKKTIDSIINQSCKDFEFIIIDGGSNDGSVSIIEENKNQISYWVSEPDSGVYNAMNKGIKAATGDFVIFMNSGDCFYDNTVLEEVLPHLCNDFDIYYGDNFKVGPSSKRLKTYPDKLQFSFFYSSCINHQSTFIRRLLFENHFYYNENYKIAADWEFFIYTICYINVPTKYLRKTIALYDFTGVSSNPAFAELHLKEKTESIQRFFPSFVEDYKYINELNSKRFLQFQYIKKYKFAWKILKAIINMILLFLPQMQKESPRI